MNNILLYSDLHISQSSLKECSLILEEINILTKKYNIDTLINLGDTFDSLHPSSQELDIFAKFIRKLGNDKQHIIIAANSHESTTETESILNHYGILSANVNVVKEFKNANHMYCGHFSLKESIKNYDAKLSKVDLKNYLYVFLGHIHSHEVIKPNIVHLGSCRYINFDEAKDKQKIVALITNYDNDQEKVHFLKLKSPIPMIQLDLGINTYKNSPKEAISDTILSKNKDSDKDTPKPTLEQIASTNPSNLSQIDLLCQQLDKLSPNTKVKVKVSDFESFKVFLPLENKYQEKFVKFVRENDFELISDKPLKGVKSEIDLKQSFEEFAKEKEIDEEIKDIINKEIK